MNPYAIQKWQDHIMDNVTLEVIQQGTPVNATHLNNMETGIFANDAYASILLQDGMQQKRSISDIEIEIIDVHLYNNIRYYPFNLSETTVALLTERNTLNYMVSTEVLESQGEPGDNGRIGNILIYDKTKNGFKIKFTGSAEGAIIRCYIQGGMYK